MIFSEDDIDFSKLNGTQFENLCYDLIQNYGFFDLVWMKGAGDRGRDIEAKVLVNYNLLGEINEHWHFECKNHTKGVGTGEIHSKIGWAQANRPDKLVFLVNPHLSSDAKQYIDKMRKTSCCPIFYIEAEQLKKLILKSPLLIEKYFISETKKLIINSIKEYEATGLIADERKIRFIINDESIIKQITIKELSYLLYCIIMNSSRFNLEHKTKVIIETINTKVAFSQTSLLNKLDIKEAYTRGFGILKLGTTKVEEFIDINGKQEIIIKETKVNTFYQQYDILLEDSEIKYIRFQLPNSNNFFEMFVGIYNYELYIEVNKTSDEFDLSVFEGNEIK